MTTRVPGFDHESAARPARQTILLVHDDELTRLAVQKRLELDGFTVTLCETGAETLAAMDPRTPDLMILDAGLPDMDGFELLRAIRRTSDVPVVMLTARDEELDWVPGQELGADDHVPRPFSARELSARVRSVLRRTGRAAPSASGAASPAPAEEPGGVDGERIAFGDLVVDMAAREVRRDGRVVETTRREFDVLAVLVAAPRRVFSREQLLRAAWDSSSDWQLPSTVTEHIRRLRIKLEVAPGQPRLIQTVRGIGYRFVPPGP